MLRLWYAVRKPHRVTLNEQTSFPGIFSATVIPDIQLICWMFFSDHFADLHIICQVLYSFFRKTLAALKTAERSHQQKVILWKLETVSCLISLSKNWMTNPWSPFNTMYTIILWLEISFYYKKMFLHALWSRDYNSSKQKMNENNRYSDYLFFCRIWFERQGFSSFSRLVVANFSKFLTDLFRKLYPLWIVTFFRIPIASVFHINALLYLENSKLTVFSVSALKFELHFNKW